MDGTLNSMCLPQVRVPEKETSFPWEHAMEEKVRALSVRGQVPCLCGCEEKPSGVSVLL